MAEKKGTKKEEIVEKKSEVQPKKTSTKASTAKKTGEVTKKTPAKKVTEKKATTKSTTKTTTSKKVAKPEKSPKESAEKVLEKTEKEVSKVKAEPKTKKVAQTTKTKKEGETNVTKRAKTGTTKKTSKTTLQTASKKEKKESKETPAEEVARLESIADKFIEEVKKENSTEKKEKAKVIRVSHREKEAQKEKEEIASTTIEEEEKKGETKKEVIVKLEDIRKSIQNRKKLPMEETKKMTQQLFKNIIMAIVVIVYFMFLNLGMMNIEAGAFITDLKVFTVCILFVAIAVLERAYQKDDGRLALHGIELIVISLVTVSLIYLDIMYSRQFLPITAVISYIGAMYYLIKAIAIYLKAKKDFFKNDMKKIIKKEE